MAKKPLKAQTKASEFEATTTAEVTIPVVEEHLTVSKRQTEKGRVRVSKTVQEHMETVQIPVTTEEVEVTHVPVERPVDRAPDVRQEGDVTIIPVTEEVVTITKQLVLKEEIHLRKTEKTATVTEDVPVRTEHVEITRMGKDDDKTE